MIRFLLTAALLFLFAALLCALLATALIFRALGAELLDDVRASRNETKRPGGGNMQPKNTKLTDIASQHRAINAKHAALLGVNTDHARAELSDAKRIGEWLALQSGRSL